MREDRYYVLVGGAENYDFFEHNRAYRKNKWFWTVPKTARPGELAFPYLLAPISRIVGQVKIMDAPFYNHTMFDNPKMHHRWVAEIGDVKFFPEREELTNRGLRALFPEWPWPHRPQGNVIIPVEIVKPFLELMRGAK